MTEDFSAQAKEYLDGVAGVDCGGAVIKIVSTSPELTGEDSAPEIISRAVKERNAAVEEKYNISLVTASRGFRDDVRRAFRFAQIRNDITPIC